MLSFPAISSSPRRDRPGSVFSGDNVDAETGAEVWGSCVAHQRQPLAQFGSCGLPTMAIACIVPLAPPPTPSRRPAGHSARARARRRPRLGSGAIRARHPRRSCHVASSTRAPDISSFPRRARKGREEGGREGGNQRALCTTNQHIRAPAALLRRCSSCGRAGATRAATAVSAAPCTRTAGLRTPRGLCRNTRRTSHRTRKPAPSVGGGRATALASSKPAAREQTAMYCYCCHPRVDSGPHRAAARRRTGHNNPGLQVVCKTPSR